MTTTRDITDNIWTDVTLVLIYVDKGNVISKEINIQKEEIEEEQREMIRERYGDEQADKYEMSNGEFQANIIRAAHSMVHAPIHGKSNATNEMRVLSPFAAKEVTIRVNNLAKIIEA